MSDYFTEDEPVLENKLNISDPVKLAEAESEIVYARAIELDLEFSLNKCKFDFECLKMIHMKLFSDIYSFAGNVRTLALAKGSSVFCYPQYIEENQKVIFAALKEKGFFIDLPYEDFIKEIVGLAETLNVLHPFREGNGRAIRFFLKKLCENVGWDLRYEDMKLEDLIEADTAAFLGNQEKLTVLFRENLKRIKQEE